MTVIGVVVVPITVSAVILVIMFAVAIAIGALLGWGDSTAASDEASVDVDIVDNGEANAAGLER